VIGSHETVLCGARACQSIGPPRARRCWHNEADMSDGTPSILRIVTTSLATLLIGLPAAWAVLALWYQAPGNPAVKAILVAFWLAFSVCMILILWHGRTLSGLLAFAVAFAVLLFWWHRLPPTNDRPWADDVAQMTTGVVAGNLVTLNNVRNFAWRSNTDYTQRWESRVYNLEKLRSVDMIMSYWAGPAIAHMLMSFGFDDGQYVVFSVEVRRLKTGNYSELGGFFKQFELSIIAAEERDVVKVRTNVRGEDDYLYRLRMPVTAMRSLFLGYVGEANSLIDSPRFYNTLTANCTTLVYHMMKRIVGYLPLNYRILLDGYLPGYVYEVGGLDKRYTLEELRTLGRITDRARQSGDSASFSEDIRKGIPALGP
jgi:hypothetical protein